MIAPLFRVRRYEEVRDGPFVRDSWRRSYRKSPIARMHGTHDLYDAAQRTVIDLLVPASRILIAHSPEDADALYGYVVAGARVAHYVYVKEAFRGARIASDLLKLVMPLRFASHGPSHVSEGVNLATWALLRRYGLAVSPWYAFTEPKEAA